MKLIMEGWRDFLKEDISARDVATGAAVAGAVIAAPLVIPAIAGLIGLAAGTAATAAGLAAGTAGVAAASPYVVSGASILLWLAFSEDEEEAYHQHYSRLEGRRAGALGEEIRDAVSGAGTDTPKLWAALELLEQRRVAVGCRAIRSASNIGAGEESGQHEFWSNVKSDLSGDERRRLKEVYDKWHSLGCTTYSFDEL